MDETVFYDYQTVVDKSDENVKNVSEDIELKLNGKKIDQDSVQNESENYDQALNYIEYEIDILVDEIKGLLRPPIFRSFDFLAPRPLWSTYY